MGPPRLALLSRISFELLIDAVILPVLAQERNPFSWLHPHVYSPGGSPHVDHAVWLFISERTRVCSWGVILPSVNHVHISFQASLLDRKTSLIGIPRGRPRPDADTDPRSPAPAARTYRYEIYGASAEARAACVCSHASPRRARVAIDGPVGRRDMCTHTMPVIHAPTTRTKKHAHERDTCNCYACAGVRRAARDLCAELLQT